MAEGVGFEPTEPFGSPVFKTGAIDHSTTPPFGCVVRAEGMAAEFCDFKKNHSARGEEGARAGVKCGLKDRKVPPKVRA